MGIKIVVGDITEMEVDVIVNAANTSLRGGGGVDGAIHKAAGPELLAECVSIGGCELGEVEITRGYNLPAKHIIHTVGPIYGNEGDLGPKLLANCYMNSLFLAQKFRLKSIAFPAISTGIFRYPKPKAAEIAVNTVSSFLKKHDLFGMEVYFVLLNAEDAAHYHKLLDE